MNTIHSLVPTKDASHAHERMERPGLLPCAGTIHHGPMTHDDQP